MWILDTKRRQPALVAGDFTRAIARANEMEDRRGRGKEESFLLSPPSHYIPPVCSHPDFVDELERKRLLRRLELNKDADMRVFPRR